MTGTELTTDPDALLEQVESDLTASEFPSQRARVFRRAAELFRTQGRDVEGLRAEWQSWLFDFMLVSRGERRSQGYGRFAPMIEMAGRVYPHVAMFPPESLLAFKEELDRSGNPIHRALYADFIWDQRERYPGPKGEPFEAAKVAVEAYLEAARQYRDNEWDDQLADALDRAAEVALSIRDANRIGRCKQACFQLAEELIQVQQHPPARWAIDVLETLQRFERQLSSTDHERIISLAEAGARFYAAERNHHIQRSFLALLPESHRALGHVDEARDALARRAEAFVAEADQAPSAIVKLHILGKALEAYQQLGDPQKVDELKRRLSQAGLGATSEMTTVSVEVRIPTAVAEAWVNRLLAFDLYDALGVLAGTKRFIPSVQEVRTQAEGQRQRFPLQYLASRHTLDSAGRIVQKALSDEEQVAASEADAYKLALAMGGWELGLAFDRLESEKGLTAETLIGFLRSRPIFEPATLDVVAVGVERYFAGDYVSALHVLVPQLEDTFRNILAKLGIARTSAQQGLTREKPLEVVLATPELRAGLGEDRATFFDLLLIRPASENLRNRTAHGLLKLEHCSRDTTQWVLFCYLQLANLAIATATAPQAGTSSVDGAGDETPPRRSEAHED
jgi:hypothetical protein